MEPDGVLKGRFRIETFLSQGGMGRIWTARDIETGRLVVVKALNVPPPGASPELRRLRGTLLKRFERECDLLARMRHRGIPRLLARGYRDAEPYMVMEHIDGPALNDFLARHTVVPSAAAAIMTQLLEALDYAHGERVVHRDVKPHNVIVGTDHVVHLIDFGIAYITDPDASRYTDGGATPGSLGYQAPELIGSGDAATSAADVYGAGCVYFFVLTGRRPFEERSDRSMADQHRYDTPPRVRDLVDHVAPEIDDIVARMLEKEPAARPSAREVIAVLCGHLPRPEAPAPVPVLVPDPTFLFRFPDGQDALGTSETRPRRGRSRRSSRPGTDRPTRAEYERLLEQAEAEIRAGEPGSATERLEETLADARAAWGRWPAVVRATLRCADAALLRGPWAPARARYREVERELSETSFPGAAELLYEARVGVVECLVAEECMDEAVTAWEAVTLKVLSMKPRPSRIAERLREVGNGLVELGHGAKIQPLLDRLEQHTD